MNILSYFLVIFLTLLAISAHGQSSSDFGMGVRPSEKPLFLPPESLAESGISIPQKPDEKQPLQDQIREERKTFVLDAVIFEGNTIFSNEELNEKAKSYLHKPISVDELEDLRRSITKLYIDKGYITSGATFPPDQPEGKILRIKIVEGKIDKVQIEGEGRLSKSYLKNRLIPDDTAPVNINELQDQFRLLSMDPLFDRLNGRLLPGPERGMSILDLKVVRSPRLYQFSVVSNNYRAPSVGAIALGANTWIRNITGLGDILDFTFMTSTPSGGDAFQYSGSWLVPLRDRTQFYFSFNKSNVSIVEEPLTNLDIKSDIFTVEGGLNHTLINSLQRRLTLGAGLAFKDNETDILGRSFSFIPGLLTGENQLSAVRINQEYIERWEKIVLAFRSTFSIGQDLFGATIQKDHRNPDSDYLSWLGQTQGLWHLPSIKTIKSDLVLKGTVQISNDPLLPLERIAVGGRNTVRGYRENQLVRDNGYAGSAEVHIHLVGNNQAKQHLTLIPFFDYGAAWNHTDTAVTSETKKQFYSIQHLYSAGIGFQYRIPRVTTEFFWAHRLTNDPVRQHGDLQDHGIHFQARLDAF